MTGYWWQRLGVMIKALSHPNTYDMLTNWSTVTIYGVMKCGQHRLREWFVAGTKILNKRKLTHSWWGTVAFTGRKFQGEVPHICASESVSIGSDNGLSSIRRQAIIYTIVGLYSIGPSGTNISEFLYQNTKLFIHENASENIVCEMAASLSKGRGGVEDQIFVITNTFLRDQIIIPYHAEPTQNMR